MSKPRLSFDLYAMNLAAAVSFRATCNRKHVGAVITIDRTIISTGYNGAISGEAHCDDVGHDLIVIDGKESCQRVVHAEINAISQAAKRGIRLLHSTLYVTTSPCWPCFRAIVHAGIKHIVYGEEFYRDFDKISDTAHRVGVTLTFCDVKQTPIVEAGIHKLFTLAEIQALVPSKQAELLFPNVGNVHILSPKRKKDPKP